MNKYKNGKIYKIVNEASDDPRDIYLGSTVNELRWRFHGHKACWKQQTDGTNPRGMLIYDAFTKYGIDNFKIMLIENFPCNSKDELERREEELRLQLKPNYNVRRAYRTYDQYLQEAREYAAIHRDQRIANEKKWVAANTDKYQCEACEYKTAKKSHYDMHLISKKHKLEYDEYIFDVEMDRMADICIFD